MEQRPDPPRGLLHTPTGPRFHHARYLPSEDLAPFVEHYWSVAWDLEAPFEQESLPYPSVHLVVEDDRAEGVGVVERRFSRRLCGHGRVFGIKLQPGGFFPFFSRPVSELTNRTLPLEGLFGASARAYIDDVRATDDDAKRVALAEAWLRSLNPLPDENAARAKEAALRIAADRSLLRVEDVATALDVSKRTLQRLFSTYVGVSPKWVIQRHRLHEVVERMEKGEPIDWARLALDLGYSDQAHFNRDFKAFVGRSPTEHLKRRRARA